MRIRLIREVQDALRSSDEDVLKTDVDVPEANPPTKVIIWRGVAYEFVLKLSGEYIYRQVQTLDLGEPA